MHPQVHEGEEEDFWRTRSLPINPSKVFTEPHTGKEEPHPSTATGGSEPCVANTAEAVRRRASDHDQDQDRGGHEQEF